MHTTPTDARPAVRLSDGDAITLALAAALKRPSLTEAEIRDAVCTFVRGRKAEGMKPEAVVIALKAIVRAATPRPAAGSPEELQGEQLMSRSVEWCIAEYFRAD